MAKYLIADFVVDFKNQYSFLEQQCKEYEYCGNRDAEIEIHISQEEIQKEYLNAQKKYSKGYIESICAYRKLCLLLPKQSAFLLHASVIAICNRGIAFLAPSGTGKTTHTKLWKQVWGNAVTIINGDKPIVRLQGENLYAYGTPWAGKENLQTNTKAKLTDICFIKQSEDNLITELDKQECIEPLMIQMLHPENPEAAMKTLELTDKVLKECHTWEIRCNTSPQAATEAYQMILGGLA